MRITWLGHSCFRLKGKQASVITTFISGYRLCAGKVAADIVTVSHPHPGHPILRVSGEPRILRVPANTRQPVANGCVHHFSRW